MLDTYEFCSDDLKKQLDGPRVAVREEEDRKANKDRAVKKAKMVRTLQYGPVLPCKYGCSNAIFCDLSHSESSAASAFEFCSFDSAERWVVAFSHMHQCLSLLGSIGYGYADLQEESDAQYKNKGKKGSKADIKSPADAASKADAAPTTASGTSTTAPTIDADKDTEMLDAPGASSSSEKKHVGELTGNELTNHSADVN